MNFGYGALVEKSGEVFAMNYIKGKLNARAIIFDVGANTGDFADEILKTFNNNLTLHCFEPSHKTFEQLTSRIKNSAVQFHNLGIGDVNGEKDLFSHSEFSGLSSVYDRRLGHHQLEMKKSETILMITIDDFCKKNHITQIDFLKLDIEGHELSALQGAGEMIKNGNIKFIQFEFGGTNIDSRTYFQDFWYLLYEKYHIYRIVKNGLRPVTKYNEGLEIFITINYLAELKAGS